MTVLLNQVREK